MTFKFEIKPGPYKQNNICPKCGSKVSANIFNPEKDEKCPYCTKITDEDTGFEVGELIPKKCRVLDEFMEGYEQTRSCVYLRVVTRGKH